MFYDHVSVGVKREMKLRKKGRLKRGEGRIEGHSVGRSGGEREIPKPLLRISKLKGELHPTTAEGTQISCKKKQQQQL